MPTVVRLPPAASKSESGIETREGSWAGTRANAPCAMHLFPYYLTNYTALWKFLLFLLPYFYEAVSLKRKEH